MQDNMGKAVLGCVMLLGLAIAINVGPTNTAGALLICTGIFWARANWEMWVAYWIGRKYLLIILLSFPLFMAMLNIFHEAPNPILSALNDARWVVLIIVSAPGFVLSVRLESIERAFSVCARIWSVLLIYFSIDAAVHIFLGTDMLINVIGLEREIPGRPSAAYNPHPFSRVLIALCVSLILATDLSKRGPDRFLFFLGIISGLFLLAVGGVRVAVPSAFLIVGFCVHVYKIKPSHPLILFLSALVLFGLARRLLEILDQESDVSLNRRWLVAQEGWLRFLDSPWYGHGVDSTKLLSRSPEALNSLGLSSGDWMNTHIHWLEILVDYGLIGLIPAVLLGGLYVGAILLIGKYENTRFERFIFVALAINGINLFIGTFSTVMVEIEWAVFSLSSMAVLKFHHEKTHRIERFLDVNQRSF